MARGLAPWFKLAGIAPTRAVLEPQRSRARRLCEALDRARWAGIFSPCEPEALEDVIPLGPSNSSSAPRASTPPRPRFSLFGDSVPLPTREAAAAVTTLPSLAGVGAPRGPAVRPWPPSCAPEASRTGRFSARKAEVSAGSLSSAPSIHPCPPALEPLAQGAESQKPDLSCSGKLGVLVVAVEGSS